MAGTTALLTGATAGIGLRTLYELAARDVHILAIGRDPLRCQRTELTLQQSIPGTRLSFFIADLSLQRDVKRIAEEIGDYLESQHLGLDLIFHVAGVFSSRKLTLEGIEVTLAVNHLAPFMLNHALMPHLQRVQGKIITVTSASHRGTWLRAEHLNTDCAIHGLWAYKLSKLANIMTTLEFNRRYADQGLAALLLDPGLVNTDIGCKSTNYIERLIWDRRQRHGVDPSVPAQALVRLACMPGNPAPANIYWRNGQPETPSRTALDPRLALRVWRATCALCGIELDPEEECKWNYP